AVAPPLDRCGRTPPGARNSGLAHRRRCRGWCAPCAAGRCRFVGFAAASGGATAVACILAITGKGPRSGSTQPSPWKPALCRLAQVPVRQSPGARAGDHRGGVAMRLIVPATLALLLVASALGLPIL